MMWTTWRKPWPRHVSFCCLSRQLPKSRGHQADEPRSQGNRSKAYLHLPPLKRSAEPQTAFSVGSFSSFRFWQAGEWQRIRGASTSLRQNTSEPNPRLRDQPFDFHVTASLLGTIATAFCRGGQLERPGDVICGGNRRISAVQAPSSSAHPFARSLSVSHVKVCDVHDASLRCGQSGQSRKIPMHRGRGDGADRPTLHSIEGWKKKSTAEAIEVSCRSADAI